MNQNRHTIILIALTCIGLCFSSSGQQPDQTGYQITTQNLTIQISDSGNVTGIWTVGKKKKIAVNAFNQFSGCRMEGKALVKKLSGGGIEFTKTLINDSLNTSCLLKERFLPQSKGGSIRWEIEINGRGEPWSTSINTVFNYPATKDTRFWTTWGGPQFSKSHIDSNLLQRVRSLQPLSEVAKNDGSFPKLDDWADPLVPMPFSKSTYYYGAPFLQYENPRIAFIPFQHNLFCIPMCTILEDSRDMGLTIALSLEDKIIDLYMQTNEEGLVSFCRLHNRISKNGPVTFALDLVAGENDWRGGLRWMTKRYPTYFNPVNAGASKVGGTGAYSNHFSSFDTDKMKKMAFTVNWQASFDFPYMGMFIPPVKGDVQWKRYGNGMMSVNQLSEYATEMKSKGFYVFNYFNVTEFGANIKPLPDSVNRNAGAESWKNASDYLYTNLSSAILHIPKEMNLGKNIYSKSKNGGMHYTWGDAIVLDCGDPVYKSFLLSQARRHVNEIPDSYGICIDRMDWLRFFNEQADDSITWYKGKPVRSLISSWKQLMSELGPIFHDAGKSVLVNNHDKRIDLMQQVDGIFDEFTYAGAPLNTTAFLCINKPAMGWTDGSGNIERVGGDNFFQKYLYMGVYPMCPFPGNDHSIQPDSTIDKLYLDYGPSMLAMKERKWLLEPNAVAVKDNAAKANIFTIPRGLLIPVVYAKKGIKVVTIIVKNTGEKEITSCVVYHPGKEKPSLLPFKKNKNVISIDVPMVRGCGIVVIDK